MDISATAIFVGLTIAVVFGFLGILVGMAIGSANKDTETNSYPRTPSSFDQEYEEEEESNLGTIEIIFKAEGDESPRVIFITCEYLDGRSFKGGSLSLDWDESGEVTVDDKSKGLTVERYDTDKETLTLCYDNVAEVKMINL